MATEKGVWNIQDVRDKIIAEEWSYEALDPATIFAFGGNTYGQLGQNNTTNYSSPRQVPGTTWAMLNGSMSGYGQGVLALKTDNTLWAWGDGRYGALAQNDEVSRSSPVQISGTTWSENFAQGMISSVAVKTDGTLWSWGINEGGNLGLNSPVNSHKSSPTQIGTGTDWSTTARQLTKGGNSNESWHCIKTDGTLWGCGSNTYGVLGLGDTVRYSSPVQIPGTWSGAKISKHFQSMAAVKSDGSLWTWGRNAEGQLGHNQPTNTWYSSPVQLGTDTTWRKVVSANYGMIATKTDGTLWSWGNNAYGAVGTNQTHNQKHRSSPTQITSGTDWNDIAVSMQVRYATKTDGTLYGWGRSDGGSLFNGTNNAHRSSPTQLQGGANDFTGTISATYGRSLYSIRPV